MAGFILWHMLIVLSYLWNRFFNFDMSTGSFSIIVTRKALSVRLQVWSGQLGEKVRSLGDKEDGPVMCVAFTDDGSAVMAGYHSGHVRRFNLLSGKWLDYDNLLSGKWWDYDNLLSGKWWDYDNLLSGKWLDYDNLLSGKWLDYDNLLR